MAILARFERDFTDEDGNVLTGNVSVTVTLEGGGVVPLYDGRDSATAGLLGNPFINDGGAVAFHCAGGAYRIDVTQGAFTRTLRYVGIGRAQESDGFVRAGGTAGQVLKKASGADYDTEWGDLEGGDVIKVATRTALKAVDTTVNTLAYLTESGRAGFFELRTGDYSAEVALDTLEGVFVKATAVAASSGAWVRSGDGDLDFSMFGAAGDGMADDTDALQGCVNVASYLGARVRVRQAAQQYLINSTILVRAQRPDGYTAPQDPPSEIVFDTRPRPVHIDLNYSILTAGTAMPAMIHLIFNEDITPDAMGPHMSSVVRGHFELGTLADVGVLSEWTIGTTIAHNIFDGGAGSVGIKVIGFGVTEVFANSLRCETGIDLSEGGADSFYYDNDYYTIGNNCQAFLLRNDGENLPGMSLFLNNKGTNEAEGSSCYFMKVVADTQNDVIRNVDLIGNRVAGFNHLVHARGFSAASNLRFWKVRDNTALDYGTKADIGLLDTTETAEWAVEGNSFNPVSVDPTVDGIKMVNAFRSRIAGNYLYNCGMASIRLGFGVKNEVTGNNIHNSGDSSTNTKVIVLSNSSSLCDVHHNMIDQDAGTFATIGVAEETSANNNRASENRFNNVATPYQSIGASSVFGDAEGYHLQGCTTNTVAVSTTTFLGVNGQQATEGHTYWVAPKAGRVRRLYAASDAAPGASQSFTYTARKGGVDQSMVLAVTGAGVFGGETTSNGFAVAAGDVLTIKLVTTSGAGVARHRYFLELEAD